METWGRDPQFFVDWFASSHSNDEAFVRWIGRYQRPSATAADVAHQMESVRQLDAESKWPAISVPTLIIHALGDPVIPVAAGRYLAERIAKASLIEVDGSDHLAEDCPELAADR